MSANAKRISRTEQHYRQNMRAALIEVLKIINPADAIQYGAMKYEDLVVYTFDWMQTEVEEITGKSSVQPALNELPQTGKMKDLIGGLSLED